jgi:thermitase
MNALARVVRNAVVAVALWACGASAAPAVVGERILMPVPDVRPKLYAGQLIVRFRPEAGSMDAGAFQTRYGLSSMRPIARTLDIRAVTFDGDEEATLAMADRLQQAPEVLYAQPAYELRLLEIPNDPYAIDDHNYADHNPDQFWLSYSNVYEAWDVTKGSPNVVVAVIDSGVDLDHPDLAANIWHNPHEIPNNGVDDDHNGYVDDVVGWDWVGQQNGSVAQALTCQLAPNSAFCRDNDPDIKPNDASVGDGQDNLNSGHKDAGVFHGTHVAGIIAAVINNHLGVAGGAPNVKIMPLRIATPEGSVNPTGLISAIDYAIQNGASIVNLSIGVPADANVEIPGLRDICQAAYDHGVAVVAAAGNGGKADGTSPGVAAPASYPSTLAVGSCNTHDQRSRYSDYGGSGNQVGVCAYGGEINATFDAVEEAIWSTGVVSKAMSDGDPSLHPGDHVYMGAVGTSMASPNAAGLAALVKSRNPSLSPAQIFAAMRSGARDVGPPGVDVQTGAGVLDFQATLAEVSTSSVAVGN